MNRRWLATAVVAVLTALLGATIVILDRREPGAAPTASGPSDPSSPSASPEGDIAFADAPSPEDAAWYRVGADPNQFPPHIQVGTMSGGITLDLPTRIPNVAPDGIIPQRLVAGVGDGVVVMVDDDGHRSFMQAIVAATGEIHGVLASDDVILDAVLDAAGREVFYVTADRLTGDLTGAWRFSTDGTGEPRAIESLVAAAPAMRLAAISQFLTRLMLSPDGSTLGLLRCVLEDCVLRTIRTDDGSPVGEIQLRRGGHDPFGITGRLAAFRPTCPDGPECTGGVVDLVNAATMPIHRGVWRFFSESVVEGTAGTVLAIQTAGWTSPPEAAGQPAADPPEIAIIGLDDLELDATYTPPLSSLRIVQVHDYAVGADLPPGWLLIQGSQPGELVSGFYALNLPDGSLQPLPAMGELRIQG